MSFPCFCHGMFRGATCFLEKGLDDEPAKFDSTCGTECCCRSVEQTPGARDAFRPWYASEFTSVEEISAYWLEHYCRIRAESERFRECFYDTTLPKEVVEAVAANLTILKSPTILRQADGRLWCWEGCCDSAGCCMGSCTHVWNYAQALSHLFPELERTLRATEFSECQDENGHPVFRAPLPIRAAVHETPAAAEGQLGGVVKVYRDWRISGDTEWMRRMWPRVRESLEYCIRTWDPHLQGVLVEPHHNTYDIEFWGPDAMCSSIYLSALKAAVAMGDAAGEDCSDFELLLAHGRQFLEDELYNGSYFHQKVQWQNLEAGIPDQEGTLSQSQYSSPESRELLEREGPKYQYGEGCLSDGLLGAWLAEVCGVGEILDGTKVQNHLRSVWRHNRRESLRYHANPQRPSYALGSEGGLLLCSWPKGDKLTLPFPYSDEVWTGIEYAVASHMMLCGFIEEGLQIVRTCRDRYRGDVRNPFDEYECGHWYARALSSYALIQGLSGIRYDAVDKTLYVRPSIKGDFRSFLCTATGYGTTGIRNGKPFLEVKSGTVDAQKIVCEPK